MIDISENNLVELVRDSKLICKYFNSIKNILYRCGRNEFEKFKFSGNNYDYVMNFSAMKHVRRT